MSIPMSSPDLTAAEIDAVHQVISTPVLSIGPRLDAFERAIAAFSGCAHGVGVNSGTSGLHLAVIAAGVHQDDYVLTTPFSFIASANCILYERAVPIFVDVDRATGNIDPALVAAAADDLARGGASVSGAAARRWLPPALRAAPPSGRLRAILPVDAFGQPADFDPILATARRHGSPSLRIPARPSAPATRTVLPGRSAMSASLPFIPTSRSPPARVA